VAPRRHSGKAKAADCGQVRPTIEGLVLCGMRKRSVLEIGKCGESSTLPDRPDASEISAFLRCHHLGHDPALPATFHVTPSIHPSTFASVRSCGSRGGVKNRDKEPFMSARRSQAATANAAR